MNDRTVSKLSAAVMTLAVLSYCGKKPHDTAAPAPANTATSYMQPTCQTADEINTHVTNADHKAQGFCFHKVEHPADSLKDGQAIALDMQLKQGLDVAFLNVEKDFNDAQTSCASLGAGWHAPASFHVYATPRASDNSNSLEAVGSYFYKTLRPSFWSSSLVSSDTYDAWSVFLPYA